MQHLTPSGKTTVKEPHLDRSKQHQRYGREQELNSEVTFKLFIKLPPFREFSRTFN